MVKTVANGEEGERRTQGWWRDSIEGTDWNVSSVARVVRVANQFEDPFDPGGLEQPCKVFKTYIILRACGSEYMMILVSS